MTDRSDEKWLPVVGWEGLYEVSSIGRVRSVERTVEFAIKGRLVRRVFPAKALRLVINRHGYRCGNMSRPGLKKNFEAHVLVCEAFHGPRPEGMQAAHADGIRLNCNEGNLRWDTPKGNAAYRTAHGTGPRGVRNRHNKLSADQVIQIRADPTSSRKLAGDFGVTPSTIKGIRSGKIWAWL